VIYQKDKAIPFYRTPPEGEHRHPDSRSDLFIFHTARGTRSNNAKHVFLGYYTVVNNIQTFVLTY